MSAPPPLSRHAEEARVLINRTLAAHRFVIAALKAHRQERRLGASVQDRVQLQRQATLVRLLSITESFAATRLTAEVEPKFAALTGEAPRRIWEAAAISATRTWSEQSAAYKGWLGVSIKNEDVETLAQARNAVAHGLGNLTRQQLRSGSAVVDQLTKFGICVEDGRIELAEDDIGRAAEVCRTQIAAIDSAVQARPARYR